MTDYCQKFIQESSQVCNYEQTPNITKKGDDVTYHNTFSNDIKDFEEIQFNESFDSSYSINKVTRDDTLTYYHVTINDIKYRIVLDRYETTLRIILDVYRNNQYRTTGITNKLSTGGTLKLFGTIFSVIKTQSFETIYIDSREPKKLQLYKKLATRLKNELFNDGVIEVHNSTGELFIYNANHKPKFKDLIKNFKWNIK